MSLLRENQHYRRIATYELEIKRLYEGAVKEASKMAVGVSLGEKPLKFNNYPALKTKANRILSALATDVIGTISAGITEEWAASNAKNDEFVQEFTKGKDLPPSKLLPLNKRNVEALRAFQSRKISGLNLSGRVWKQMAQFKQELEMALDLGIGQGQSAAAISRDVRPYLNEPEKLFRRVKNKHGNLVLSKNAAAYHPGQGVYRSSYKNALRLTRTETNMAYKAADFERWNQLDFVVGIQVIRSNNPYSCDVCESLIGRYPKDYRFIGNHPNCRCRAVPIFASDEEFDSMLEGENVESINKIKDVPAGFKGWVKENKEAIKGWKSKPYFLTDNNKYAKDLLL